MNQSETLILGVFSLSDVGSFRSVSLASGRFVFGFSTVNQTERVVGFVARATDVSFPVALHGFLAVY